MESLRGGATAVPALLAGALVLTPPATPQPRVRLLGAKAARDRLRPVCAAPLSVSVREADGAAAARARSRAANLTGRWLKDWAASDSMEPTAEAMQLPWVMRKALRLVSELQIRHDDAEFATCMSAGIISIAENYAFTGELRQHPRRDLRAGNSRGSAAVVPLHVSAAPPERTGAHGAAFAAAAAGAPTSVVRVTTEWDEPYGGVATETFALSGTVLTVDTAMQFKSLPGGVAYRTVYRRC